MYIRIIENKVEKEKQAEYKVAMAAFVEDLLKLDECLSIDIAETSDGVVTIERWANEVGEDVTNILIKHKKKLKDGFISNSEQIFIN